MRISWLVYLLAVAVLAFIFVWPGFIWGRPIWGPSVVAGQPSGQPTATATATQPATPTPTPIGATPVTGGTVCQKPVDQAAFEALPRMTLDAAPLGQFFHPVFDPALFQTSSGKDGQWNWTDTVCYLRAEGGRFILMSGVDGTIVFRVTETKAVAEISILTSSKYKREFMPVGKENLPIQVSIHTMPNQMVWVLDPTNGNILASKAVSPAGDIAITLPDDGLVRLRVQADDPASVKDVFLRFGPDDRPDSTLHLDARPFAR